MQPYLHLALVLGLAFGLVGCDAFTTSEGLRQITSPDDSALSDSLRRWCREDAAHLAMRLVVERQL